MFFLMDGENRWIISLFHLMRNSGKTIGDMAVEREIEDW